MEDAIDSQRERFSAVLRQGVGAGSITLDEYESKLGAIYAAQSIAELETLVPWALAPQRKRSRVTRFSIAGGLAAALVAVTVVALMALSVGSRVHVASSAHPAVKVHVQPPSSLPAGTPRGSVPRASASVTAAPSSVPSATTLPAVVPVGQRVYGPPTGSTDAVVSLDTARRQVTLMSQTGDVAYSVCAGFRVVKPGGGEMGLPSLQTGTFGTVEVNRGVPCLESVQILPTASLPECTSSTGLSGDGDVRWEGFNPSDHSVLYRGVSYGPVNATRWCGAPTVVGPSGAAIRMSQIPIGSG